MARTQGLVIGPGVGGGERIQEALITMFITFHHVNGGKYATSLAGER